MFGVPSPPGAALRLLAAPIRRLLAEEGDFVGDGQALALEIVGDGAAKPGSLIQWAL